MTVTNIWVGGVTDTVAWARGKVTGTSTRLAVSTHADLSSPTWFGPVTPVLNIASIQATGLTANTQYYFALEDDGVLDTARQGKFRTFPVPGTAASFTLCAAGCAGDSDTGYNDGDFSNHPVFDTIRELDPLFFLHIGDMHYKDISSTDQDQYRSAYDSVLAQSRQAALYRSCGLAYIWDDHDFGPNNSDGTIPGRDAACLTYRERVPSYPLVEGAGAKPIYQSFTVGRCLFILTDLRANRDPDANDPTNPAKTILGATQKAWFINLLNTTDAEMVFWVSSSPWIASGATTQTVDTWGEAIHERQELADAIVAAGLVGRFCILSSDLHSLAIDDGSNNAWGGFPVYHFGSMDATANQRGGPYSVGFSTGQNRYGIVTVKDHGDGIVVTGTGMIGTSEWASHSFRYPSTFVPPHTPVGAGITRISHWSGDRWLAEV